MELYNKYDKKLLKERLQHETFVRVTFSFYRYVKIDQPEELRDELYTQWCRLNAFGRVYLANEGINAQMSIPKGNYEELLQELNEREGFENIDMKIAVEDEGKSFYKLKIKVREKILADGLNDSSFDVTQVGAHLTAAQFNAAMKSDNTVVVDFRNHYESEIGHFKEAFLPDADTFSQAIPIVMRELSGKEENKILLYCTGGIRCEKASAYLKHKGFVDVNQLKGGIISYADQVKKEKLKSNYIGKNFVFDERLGERITPEIISACHQCGEPCDEHTNCKNDDCHLLFIQCNACGEEYGGCCTSACKEIAGLPLAQQQELRKGPKSEKPLIYAKGRLRPKLSEFISGTKRRKN
ncbi:MAG TPA: rhodanese-related sulfurtransferase [Flavobacteriales bacterium]|nr:rhodanese-related sulfurtransferase [Flavobacteriales bacterium]HIA11592.1 rhodanese-related sulfurtransferase [Flavobacteriales bacterium]HIO72877.1 rhodanese-related sulfurtransferase [Flavobacteriales bacterium]